MADSDKSPEPARPGTHRRRRRFAGLPARSPLLVGLLLAMVGVLVTATMVRSNGPASPTTGEATPGHAESPRTPEPSGSEPGGREQRPGLSPPSSLPVICPAFPEFPDASCTGYRHTGVELRPCPTEITQDGAELDGCRFSSSIALAASDVTITRSLIEGTIHGTHETDWSLGNLTLIDVEIDGQGQVVDGQTAAIGDHDYTCIRCDIHGSERGANLGHNIHIEDSYLHDFIYRANTHQTAIGSNGGADLTLVHNHLDCESNGSCSAALAFYPDFEPLDNILVQNNLLNTNGGYCTYGGFDEGTNIRYIDNVFGTKYNPECGVYGPVAAFEASAEGNVWRGNRYPDGTEVEPQSGV
jgi:hypothetical protein